MVPLNRIARCSTMETFLRRVPGNNLNQIARTVNQTHILKPCDRELLVQGIGQLIKEVESDFNIKCQQLKEFYGSH